MKQTINFYQDEFKKPEIKFSARQMVQTMGIVLFLMILGGGYQYWLKGDLVNSIEQVNSENKRLESDIDERHNALELVKIDPKLESTLKQLKLKNADKRRVTSYINNMGLDNPRTSVTITLPSR